MKQAAAMILTAALLAAITAAAAPDSAPRLSETCAPCLRAALLFF